MRTFKALSILLSYPDEETREAVPVLRQALAEGVIAVDGLAALEPLLAELQAGDPWDLQERYVMLFDRSRTLSLNLFEHVHGESRDRGQAMVDLLKIYEDAGFTPTASELPDYLPLFLEFASTRPPQAALELVGEPGHVLAALAERLRKRGSPYEAVFSGLVALSKATLDKEALAALRAEPDPEPDDLAALDAAWEEEEVTFGPGSAQAACGKDTLAAKLRQARRPAPGLEPAPMSGPRTVVTTSRVRA